MVKIIDSEFSIYPSIRVSLMFLVHVMYSPFSKLLFSTKHAKWQLRLSDNKMLWQLVTLARLYQYELCMLSCYVVLHIHKSCPRNFNSVEVVLSVEDSALTDVSSDQLLPG